MPKLTPRNMPENREPPFTQQEKQKFSLIFFGKVHQFRKKFQLAILLFRKPESAMNVMGTLRPAECLGKADKAKIYLKLNNFSYSGNSTVPQDQKSTESPPTLKTRERCWHLL